MNRFLTLFIFLFITSIIYGQKTYVPDDNFEQELIDLGLDDVLDDSVLTAGIAAVEILNVSSLEINDLTGIEGFTALHTLGCFNNNLDTINLSENALLENLNIIDNNINDIDLSANALMEQLGVSGNGMESIDLTPLANLVGFNAYGNLLEAVDFSSCPLLEQVELGANKFVTIDLSNNPELMSVFCSDNNDLIFLSVKNGNNEIILGFSATFCPKLTCIEVDDPAYSEENWVNVDPMVSFSTNCGLSVEINDISPLSIYPQPASGEVNIVLEKGQLDYELMNIAGKVLLSGNLQEGLNTIEVEDYPGGIYFLQFTGADNLISTRKVILH